jgi:hypothetical protein
MAHKSDLLTVDEAIAKYGHSRAWWFDRIKKGDLVAYDILGRRETFVSEREIEEMLRPRPRRPDDAPGQTRSSGNQTTG